MKLKIIGSLAITSLFLAPSLAFAEMPYGKIIDILAKIEAAYKQIAVLEAKLHAIEPIEKKAPQIVVEPVSCAKDLCIDAFYATSTPTKMTITWKTNRPATSKIWWGNDISTDMTPLTDRALSVSHTATFLSTFATSTTFHYIVSATDENGNAATSSVQEYVTPSN